MAMNAARIALGMAVITGVWVAGLSPALAQSAPRCVPGSGPPCQQAFFQISKTTGKVTAAAPLQGANQEGSDYDAVECHGAGGGKCFLAADRNGFLLMNFSSLDCDPKTSVAPVGAVASTTTIEGLAFDTSNGTLYALVGDQLEKVDQASGTLSPVGGPLGEGMGAGGGWQFGHVSAFAFDPSTGKLLAVEARGGGSVSLLFRIDPATGTVAHGSFGPGLDYVEVAPDGARNQVLGMVVVGGTLYATMSLNDGDPHLATINPATGASSDIGAQGVPSVGGLTADASGQLYGVSGTGGAVVTSLPCPGAVPQAATKAVPAAPPAEPPVQVLGVSVTKPGQPPKLILPVTGFPAWLWAMAALLCYLLGAGALAASRRALLCAELGRPPEPSGSAPRRRSRRA
jgi:hypothetical protein